MEGTTSPATTTEIIFGDISGIGIDMGEENQSMGFGFDEIILTDTNATSATTTLVSTYSDIYFSLFVVFWCAMMITIWIWRNLAM